MLDILPAATDVATDQVSTKPSAVPGGLVNFGGGATLESVRRNYDDATLARLASVVEEVDTRGTLAAADIVIRAAARAGL